MKKILQILVLFCVTFYSCIGKKTYYAPANIHLKSCYKLNGNIFFEYQPTLESIHDSPGVDVEYNNDSSEVKLFFIRQNSKLLKQRVTIPSRMLRPKDGIVIWQIKLPKSVSKIIVAPPDSVFIESVKEKYF